MKIFKLYITSRKLLLTSWCFLLVFICSAQHNNNWAIGFKSGITFNTNPPSLIETALASDTSSSSHARISSSYSNCNGELIVYGSGQQLWNRLNKPLKNGSIDYGQAAYHYTSPIIPMPGSSRFLYYFYHTSNGVGGVDNAKFKFSIIDLNGDQGLGEVILKDQFLDSSLDPFAYGGNNLTYTYHSNKKDIWILFASSVTSVKAFLLTDTGLVKTPFLSKNIYSGNHSTQIKAGQSSNSPYRNIFLSQFKMTHDGKNLIATAIDTSTTKLGCSLMYDFDQSTGKLSNPSVLLKFDDIPKPSVTNDPYYLSNFYYTEISSNDSNIYFASWTQKMKIPFDYSSIIHISEIVQVNRFNKQKKAVKKLQYSIVGLQIGPDHKIYTIDSKILTTLRRLEYPNLIGSEVELNDILSDSALWGTISLPTVYQPFYKLYYTSNLTNNPCADSARFDVHVDDFFREFRVYFGDGDSLVFKSPLKPSYSLKHKYKSPGKYFFEVRGLSPRCDYYTKSGDSVTVSIPPKLWSSASSYSPSCLSANYQRLDSFVNTKSAIYKWMNTSSDTLVFSDSLLYASHAHSKSFLNGIDSGKHFFQLELRNAACPLPIVVMDSVDVNYHPPLELKYNLSFNSTPIIDSFAGKLRYSGCSPLAFSFSDSSMGLSSGSLNWQVDSMLYSSSANLNFQLPKGDYQFVVNDSNQFGCHATDTFYIQSYTTPKITWNSAPNNQCFKGHLASLNLNITDYKSGQIHWGDSDSSSLLSDSVFSHRYLNSGNYIIQIRTQNENQCSANADTSFSLFASPDASFTLNSDTQCLKQNLFTAQNFNSGSHLWNFGFSDTAIPVHRYSSSGAKQVTHILTDSNSCKDTAVVNAFVHESPQVNFTLNDTVFCSNTLALVLQATSLYSQISNLSHTIKWGDGNTNTFIGNQSLSHSYSTTGNYKIELEATSLNTCSDSHNQEINLLPLPEVKLTAEGLCLGDSTFITANALGGAIITSHQWFIDNTIQAQNGKQLSTLFNAAKDYNILINIEDAKACKNSDTLNITIHEKPKADFYYVHFEQSNNGVKFLFKNTSTNSNSWIWDFENGDSSKRKDVEYLFLDTGNYKVKLIASNNGVCKDTIELTLPVYYKLEFFFPNVFSPDGNDLNESFGLSPSQMNLVKNFKMRIYNRWGEMLFSTENPKTVWTGKHLQQGVYIYKIEIRDIYNVLHEKDDVVEVLK
jgi:hypothetical protein